MRLLEEDRRKSQEAHRRAIEQDESRAKEPSAKRERRGRRLRERERREREDSSVAEIVLLLVQPSRAQLIRIYEKKRDTLHGSNTAETVELLESHDIPWPVFETVRGAEDVTREQVWRSCATRHTQGGEGQAKTIRTEILRWHPG
jgi:hypothetical protein